MPQPEAREAVLDLFRSTGAYLAGHFRLTSGLHSPAYLQCALVLQHPRIAEDLGRRVAGTLGPAGEKGRIRGGGSPPLRGPILGHAMARPFGGGFIFSAGGTTRK